MVDDDPSPAASRDWLRRIRLFAGRLELYNFGRWLLLSALIGVVAGLGAAFFTWGIEGVSEILHGRLLDFAQPGHGAGASPEYHLPTRPWLLLIILPVAGLIVGWLVQTFAPEAEGHGTDAVIKAIHRDQSRIRPRVVPIKLVASMLTIGSGGSAGREGPVAQVGAGFASWLASLLRLTVQERQMFVIAGVAGGIGGMFRAPLGGALFACDVLYSENDFESEALIPSIMASIISYVVNCSLTGWGPIFHAPVMGYFSHPLELVPYLFLGFILALVGIAYVKTFYGVQSVFAKMPVPEWTKPGIGAFLVALIALWLPQVMGGGYGWLQLTLDEQLPFKLLLILVPAKILATCFTISSGGSGGVFAPSLIIGGMTGAVFADVVQRFAPQAAPSTAACVLVGMGGFFSGVAKVPMSSLIMVAEMSGSYRLLVPMLVVGTVSFLLTRGSSIYDEQVAGKVDSPAHVGEYEVDVLQRLKVADVMIPGAEVTTFNPGTPFTAVVETVADSAQEIFPVVTDEGKMVGIFSLGDVRRAMATQEVWPLLVADDLGVDADEAAFVEPWQNLHVAVRRFAGFRVPALPVLDERGPAPLIGLLEQHAVAQAYDRTMRQHTPPATNGNGLTRPV